MFDARQFAQRLADRQDCWSLLQEFVSEWHTPLQEGDGFSAEEIDAAEQRLGLKLPLALRELYLLAGKREDVVAVQNWLVNPADLEVEDYLGTQALTFYSENQGCVHWGIPLDRIRDEDPPVILDETGQTENATLSQFVLQMILLETAYCGRINAHSHAKPEVQEAIRRNYVLFELPVWHSFPGQLYGGQDVLFVLFEDEVSVAARSMQALWETISRLDDAWCVSYNGEQLN